MHGHRERGDSLKLSPRPRHQRIGTRQGPIGVQRTGVRPPLKLEGANAIAEVNQRNRI